MLVKLWKIVNFKISCQPEFATYLYIVVSAHWEYVFEDIVDSITQCPFYEDAWEKFLSGLSTRKSCTSPEQLVCFYLMDTENFYFPLCFGHEEAQNWICGPPLAIEQDFVSCIYILILLASFICIPTFIFSNLWFIYILFIYIEDTFILFYIICLNVLSVYMWEHVCIYLYMHAHICICVIVCIYIYEQL